MKRFPIRMAQLSCLACAAMSFCYGQAAHGAVHSDSEAAFSTTVTNPKLPEYKKAETATPDVFDAGYFKLQAETCLPLNPARQTVARIAGSKRPSNTADAVLLDFNWRQIQHYRAETVSPYPAVQCYYIAR